MTALQRTLAAFALVATLATGISPAFAHHPHPECRLDQDGFSICEDLGWPNDDLVDLIDHASGQLGPTIPAAEAL